MPEFELAIPDDLAHLVKFIVLVVTLTSLFITAYLARALSKRYASDVRTVWYFFALAQVVSFMLFLWGLSHEAFMSGRFNGETGRKLQWLLDTVADVETDFLVLLALVIVLVAPQVLSYLLSGLWGCSTKFWFFSAALPFLIWGMVKFFAVFAGVYVTIGIATALFVFELDDAPGPLGFAASAVGIGLAFSLLFLYRRGEEVAARIAAPTSPHFQ